MGSTEDPEFPDVAHPLVWTHPERDLQSLCVRPTNLIDVADSPESLARSVETLRAHCRERDRNSAQLPAR